MSDSSQTILNRMLSNVDPEYDTSTGSFFYDFNAPMSIELSDAYKLIESILIRRNVETATGDDLTAICSEEGIDRHQATYAIGQVILKGIPGAKVLPGDLVSNGLINFEILESNVIPSNGQMTVNVRSKVLGSIGNVPIGSINSFPKTLTGISSVNNIAPTTGGYDQESDDSLKERYYIKVRTPATSGNKYHYEQWAREVVGVGSAKVFDTWNGAGTVKVVILDSNKKGASQELTTNVFNYIESQRPVGPSITVLSAMEISLNITATLTLSTGQTANDVKTKFSNSLAEYLKSVAFNTTYISIAQVGNILLDTGIKDFTNLQINGKAQPVILTEEQIPIVGTISFS